MSNVRISSRKSIVFGTTYDFEKKRLFRVETLPFRTKIDRTTQERSFKFRVKIHYFESKIYSFNENLSFWVKSDDFESKNSISEEISYILSASIVVIVIWLVWLFWLVWNSLGVHFGIISISGPLEFFNQRCSSVWLAFNRSLNKN